MTRFQSKRQVFLCTLSWAFVAACMALIFSFSQQPGVQSQSLSDGVLSRIFDLVGLYRTDGRGRPFLAWGLAVLYAVTDELHQIFIPGRACRFFDVCVDAAGALAGIVFCLLVAFLWKKLCEHRTR